jgi:hypothetical protein
MELNGSYKTDWSLHHAIFVFIDVGRLSINIRSAAFFSWPVLASILASRSSS